MAKKERIQDTKGPMGLKAMSTHRHLGARRRFVPKDTDGSYRVEGRKDGVSAREVLQIATQAEES